MAYSSRYWEPYVSATCRCDISREAVSFTTGAQPDNDRDDIGLGIGLRFYSESISGSLSCDKTILQRDFDADALNVTVRAEF